MMYISAYPIAIAVRGTNVYEVGLLFYFMRHSTHPVQERSLGVYHDREEQEASADPQEMEVFSKYLGWHGECSR
jgi:Trk-type K+ transport system membrane component